MLDQFRWALLSPGDKVLVAISGGPDSLSLLHLLWTQQEARQIRSVEAAHLDHGLRGAESAAEAQWVLDWCAERGIACHVGKADTAAQASAHKQSVQEAARAVRYAFLERTAAAVGADKIATGHTRDDQAETVLASILRGTGLDGLRGIPQRRGLFIRPLLDTARSEIEAYCTEHSLFPRQDISNFSPDHYTRNRIRLELLPLLRRGYNLRVDDALVRLSAIAAQDSDFLATQAQAALADVAREGDALEGDAFHVQLDRAALTVLHPALLRGVLRQAISRVRGSGTGVSYSHLESVCRAVVAPASETSTFTLPNPPCRVSVEEARVILALPAGNVPAPPAPVFLPVPGEVFFGAAGGRVRAVWQAEAGAVPVDADAVDRASLAVRAWRFGDKIDPLGMDGRHKKLSDIFTDAKVPRSERPCVPIVADCWGIVWVPGHTLAERVKVTAETTRVLYFCVRSLESQEPVGKDERNRE